MSINAADWQVIKFCRTVANGFRLELGRKDDPAGEAWDETRSFEWEAPQFTPVFEAADVDWRPPVENPDEAVPQEAIKALAQDAFAQMEREANPPAPAVADGTSLAELIS
jgi:hypothetical protein